MKYEINQEVMELINTTTYSNDKNLNENIRQKVINWILHSQNDTKNKCTWVIRKVAKDNRYTTLKMWKTFVSFHTIILFASGSEFVKEVKSEYKGREYITLIMCEYKGQKYNAHHLKDRKDNRIEQMQVLTEQCHNDVDRQRLYEIWRKEKTLSL